MEQTLFARTVWREREIQRLVGQAAAFRTSTFFRCKAEQHSTRDAAGQPHAVQPRSFSLSSRGWLCSARTNVKLCGAILILTESLVSARRCPVAVSMQHGLAKTRSTQRQTRRPRFCTNLQVPRHML